MADLDAADGQVQRTEHKIAPTVIRHLKVTISAGHSDFSAVYRMIV